MNLRPLITLATMDFPMLNSRNELKCTNHLGNSVLSLITLGAITLANLV